MKRKLLCLLCVCALLGNLTIAQEKEDSFKPTMQWKGWTHIWTSYAMNDGEDPSYGLTVRYLRFKALGKLAPNIKWAAQFGFDRGTPAFVDLTLAWEPMDYLKVQVGRFPVPGVKSGNFSSKYWSTTKMILIDRATITQNYSTHTGLSGFRSQGVMLYGGFLENKLNYYTMLATSLGSMGSAFNPSVKSPTYSHDEDGLASFSRFEVKLADEINFGVNFHYGKGTSEDTISVKRVSYTLFYFMKLNELTVMTEFIGGQNKTYYDDVLNNTLDYNGFLVEGGYRIAKKYEPALRFDYYIPTGGDPDNLGYNLYYNTTIGFNYYPASNIALMLNYVLRSEVVGDNVNNVEEIDNDLIYLQLRYLFKSN